MNIENAHLLSEMEPELPKAKKKRPPSKLPFKVTAVVPLGREKAFDDDSFSLPSIRDAAHRASPSKQTSGPSHSFDFRNPEDRNPYKNERSNPNLGETNLGSIISKRASHIDGFPKKEYLGEEMDQIINFKEPI